MYQPFSSTPVGGGDLGVLEAGVVPLAHQSSNFLLMSQRTAHQLETGFAEHHAGNRRKKKVDAEGDEQEFSELAHDGRYDRKPRKFR